MLKSFARILLIIGFAFGSSVAFAEDKSDFLIHGGLKRTYLVHTPTTLRSKGALIVALHGGYGSGQAMANYTKFNDVSEQFGFVVAYPDAFADPNDIHERHWNDGRAVPKFYSQRNNIDDVGFISDLIEKVVRDFDLDPKRVYITGISNGAMMTERLGCDLTNIAAIAPVAGSIPLNIQPTCHPTGRLPIAIFNGTKDPMVPWNGGTVYPNSGRVISVAETTLFWAKNNSCRSKPQVRWLPHLHPDDPTRVRVLSRVCGGGSEVSLFAIDGGGHTWPGAEQSLPIKIVGLTTYDINASAEIWDFFSRH